MDVFTNWQMPLSTEPTESLCAEAQRPLAALLGPISCKSPGLKVAAGARPKHVCRSLPHMRANRVKDGPRYDPAAAHR